MCNNNKYVDKNFLEKTLYSISRRNDLDYNSGDDWKDGSFFSGDERGENASLDVEENLVSIMILFLAIVPI